jgi:1-acyl-sn-glycerol-3-phosphate acyltransferase
MFPEGTRGGYARLRKIHSGIGLIAAKSKVPVLPAYIEGSDHVLPPGAKWPRRKLVKVTIGAPLIFPENQSYPEMANQIMQGVLALAPQQSP